MERDDGEAGPAVAGGLFEAVGGGGEQADGGQGGDRQADGRQRVEPRRRLIEAAIELFGTVGYAGTTIETLCARARLSTRDFYKSFVSRQDLLRAVLEEQVVDRYQSIEAVLHAAPPTLVVEQVSAIGGDSLPTMSEAQQAMMAGFFIGGIREVMQQFTDGAIGPVSSQELVGGLTELCLQVLSWKPEPASEPPSG